MPAIAHGTPNEHLQPPQVLSAQEREEIASLQSKENDGKGSLILRIKRKRGTEPISALRIESLLSEGIDPSEVEQHAKSLNKGEEEASQEDASDSSMRVKRRLTDRGVFRLAETVSLSSFSNAKATRHLEQRISELKKAPVPASPVLPTEPPASTDSKSHQASSASNPTNASALRFKIIKPLSVDRTKHLLFGGALKGKGSSGSLRSRAALAKTSRNASKSSLGSLRKGSETVGNTRKSPYPSKLRFIDAVMDISGKSKGVERTRKERRKGVAPDSQNKDTEMESLDRRFADLLGNYLKENDLQPPADLYESTTTSATKDPIESEDSDSDGSEGDYVYDIYFREKETMWGSGPAGASDAGLRPAEVAGHESSNALTGSEIGQAVAAESQYLIEPMATLVGFSDEDDLINEMENASRLMSQEVPNDSSDEFDEGEDEDSNDEGFYRNDYPEDEGEDDDEFNQAGWGWSGPRRRGQRVSSSDEDEDDGEDEESDDLHE